MCFHALYQTAQYVVRKLFVSDFFIFYFLLLSVYCALLTGLDLVDIYAVKSYYHTVIIVITIIKLMCWSMNPQCVQGIGVILDYS